MTLPRTKESRKRPPKAVFLAATIVFFVLSLSAADSIGFVPCDFDGTCSVDSLSLSDLPTLGDSNVSVAASAEMAVEPIHLTIDKVGVDLPVQNPQTRDLKELD